eukprot:g2609.t1
MDLPPSATEIPQIPAKTERDIVIQQGRRKVKHSWKRQGGKVLLTSVLLRVDGRECGGVVRSSIANDLDTLSSVCEAHACTIQDRADRTSRSRAAGAAPAAAGRKRHRLEVSSTNAVLEAAAPLPPRRGRQAQETAGLVRSARSAASGIREDSREGATPSGGEGAPGGGVLTAAAIQSAIDANPALLEELGLVQTKSDAEMAAATVEVVELKEKLARVEKNAELHTATIREITASLASLRENTQYEVGRMVYQAVLSAVAGTGNASPGVSAEKRAASLNVRAKTFRDAQARMSSARHDLPPQKALDEGVYVYNLRETRMT